MAFRVDPHLLKVFIDLGLVPANCHSVSVIVPGNGALMLRYDVFIDRAHLPKLSAAFAALEAAMNAPQTPLQSPDPIVKP